jgi:hypothetical protein
MVAVAASGEQLLSSSAGLFSPVSQKDEDQ